MLRLRWRERVVARAVDVALAAGVVVAVQVEIRYHGDDGMTGGPLWLNVATLSVFGVLFAGWRVAPGATVVATSLVLAVPSAFTVHDTFFWTTMLPLLAVVYSNARRGDGLLARWGWVLPVLALLSDALHTTEPVSNLATSVVVMGGASRAARLVRRTEQQRDQLEATLSDLASAQAQREEAAAAAEHNRIATEMHDLVAHAVTEMVVQLGAARMGLLAARDAVPGQLVAAEATGRQALADLRSSLGGLPGHPEHGLAPVPGLAEVEGLVTGFRRAGLEVAVQRGDGPGLARLPTGLQLSVHRVLQEALTNALKHAGPVQVDVALARSEVDVRLDVVNGPPRRRPDALPSGRHGLVGMRERVAVYGGQLDAGPTADGGWRVRAVWPVPA